MTLVFILAWIISTIFSVYYIRKWSKQWNYEREPIRLKKVNLKLQTFLAIVPLCIFIAAYRIQKLKKTTIMYFVFTGAAIILSSSITFYILFPSYIDPLFQELYPAEYYTNYDNTKNILYYSFLFILAWIISTIFPVYYIRKWSKQWNYERELCKSLFEK